MLNEKYTLDNIILRKEFFGGIISTLDTHSYHQVNEDGFKILKNLKAPKTITELKNDLDNEFSISENALTNFVHEMISLSIVCKSTSPKDALVYFENEKTTRTDCLNAPTSVSIYITQFCPKECKHCVTYSSPHVKRDNEVSPENWFKVIDKLRAFGCTTLVFTGGDCLAKERIFDIIKKADDEKFLIGILTDYDGINSKHLERLKSIRNLIDVQVSLDGGKPETHDWMRGIGSFDKAIRRMKMLQTEGIPYTVAAAIHKSNIDEIDKIAEICCKYGATHLYLNPLAPYGRGKDLKQYFLSDDELYSLGQKYLELISRGITSSGNPFWEQNIDKIGDTNFHPFKACLEFVSTGFFNLSINWSGDCYLDSKLSSEKILYLGNAVKDDIKTIWFNPKLDPVRKLYKPGDAFISQDKFVSSLKLSA